MYNTLSNLNVKFDQKATCPQKKQFPLRRFGVLEALGVNCAGFRDKFGRNPETLGGKSNKKLVSKYSRPFPS